MQRPTVWSHRQTEIQPGQIGPPHVYGGNVNSATPPSFSSPFAGGFNCGPGGPAALNLPQLDPVIIQVIHFFQSSLDTIVRDREAERAVWRQQLGELENRQRELEARLQQQQHQPFQGQRGPPPRRWSQRRHLPIPTAPAEDTPEVNHYLERSAALDEAHKKGESVAVEGAKCQFFEHVGDLRDAPQVIKVQAVAADLKCSRGVAAAFTERLGRPEDEPGRTTTIGDVVVQEAGDMGTLLNVVVKEKSHHKYYKKPEPYLVGVRTAFRKFAEYLKKAKFDEIAVSYMCSGTERLHRLYTMDLLYQELKDVPVKVHFYNVFPSRRWEGAGALFRAAEVEEQRAIDEPAASEAVIPTVVAASQSDGQQSQVRASSRPSRPRQKKQPFTG
jgi:hypothetical protein